MKMLLLPIVLSIFSASSVFATEIGLGGQYTRTVPVGSDKSLNVEEAQALLQFSFFEKSPVRLYLGLGAGYGTLTVNGNIRSGHKDAGKRDDINQEIDSKKSTFNGTITEKNRLSVIAEIGPEFRFNRFFRLQAYYGIDASIMRLNHLPRNSVKFSGTATDDSGAEVPVSGEIKGTAIMHSHLFGKEIPLMGVPFTKIGLRALVGLGKYFDLTLGAEYITISAISFSQLPKNDNDKPTKLRLAPTRGSHFHATNLTAGLRFRF